MKKKEDLHIDLFEDAGKKFKQHLEIEGNERIIFSGKFGHGKTTFLREFFDIENQNDREEKYEVISLFPVNYSVSSNEDIFKYIKYDIILEMLNKNYQVEEVLINEIEALHKYMHENSYKIFSTMLSMIAQVGKDLSETFDKIIALSKSFEEYHANAENKANEENQLIEYINKIERTEGNIFEDNIVSNLIAKILRKNNGDRKSILLIDDLDRIDPEHIFRILNVFAAHFDRKHKLSKNKFGFDKVVLVCDIDNVRNVFKAKYGGDTDFNGYIDKFYSYEIFNYYLTPKEIWSFAFQRLIKDSKLDDSKFNHPTRLNNSKNILFKNSDFFADIIKLLLENRELDLRNLLKWTTLKIPYNAYAVFPDCTLDIEEFPILFYLQFLCVIKGNPECLKNAIKNINGKTLERTKLWDHITNVIYLITILEHQQRKSVRFYYKLRDIELNIVLDENGKPKIEGAIGGKSIVFTNSDLSWVICDCIDFLCLQNIL